MNPILFAKDETNFTTNGLGRLECISCEITEERNGIYELEAEIPISGQHASEIEMQSIIGAIPHDGGNIQAFYVYKIGKPINGRFKIYARHISYRLTDIPCAPFSIELSATAAADTLVGLKSHAIESCPFNFYTDVSTPAPYTQKTPASIRQRLGGVEGSVIDQFGGEFEWDNWDVRLLKQRGRLANVTGISLRYGKNITDINQEEEISNTITGVVPFWIDTDGNNLVMLPEFVVYSEYADNYPYHLTQVLDLSGEYEDKPTANQLRGAANTYINKTGLGIPKVSIRVSFVNLWETEEYKDIAPLERVQLCDEINVEFEKLGISVIAKVVKTRYDVLNERYIQIEVGNIRTSLAQAVTDRDKDIDSAFVSTITKMSQAVQTATAWLTNANGYVVARKNEDGSWKELLFMNTNDPARATSGIRINNNGIGFFSKILYPAGNVLDGPYSTAWTIDGRLGDAADKNFWNFITGQFSLSAGTTVGGQTVQQIADAAQAAAENTAASALAAQVAIYDADIADLQNQIDGNVTTWYYSGTPTLNNLPASQWTTTTDKDNHIGDLYYDSATGYAYRFMKDGNNYVWTKISDSDISAALAEAQDAWDLADNKRRVFITQPVPPYDLGDLWVEGSNGDIKRCATAKTSTQAYSASDWVLASKYTDDTAVTALNNALNQTEIYNRLTNNSQNEGIFLQDGHLYLNASMINAGTMSADRLIGGSIYLGDLSSAGMLANCESTALEQTYTGEYSYYFDIGYSVTNAKGFYIAGVETYNFANSANVNLTYTIKKTTNGGTSWTDVKNGSLEQGIGRIPYRFEVDSNSVNKYFRVTISNTHNTNFSMVASVYKTNTIIDEDGILTNKLISLEGCQFGNLFVDKKIVNPDGVDRETYYIYSRGWKEYFYQEWSTLSKSYSTYVYFSPANDGWKQDVDINVAFMCDDSSSTDHENVEVCRVTLYQWSGTRWTQLEYRRFNSYGWELDNKDTYFTGFSKTDERIYRLRILVVNKSWASNYNLDIWTDEQNILEMDAYETIGNFRGSFTGSASLYALAVGEVNFSPNGTINFVDADSDKNYAVSSNGFSSQASTDTSTTLTSSSSSGPLIEAKYTSTNYVRIQNHQMWLEEDSNNYSVFQKANLVASRNGNTYSIAWTTSDRRFKEEIDPLDVELSKNLIDATETKKFKYKDSEGKHYGMIAQEAREILDSLGETDAMLEHCTDEGNEMNPRTIDYHEYIPHIINYIKDLRAEITILKAEVNELKKHI